jgi:PAS domain S-box-containing protein
MALALVLTGACAFLFNVFYREAKNTAITKLNEEQMIHARQAARGIEDFFTTWVQNLTSLSKIAEIIDNDPVGQRYLKLFYETNQKQKQIMSITRVDERGVIIYNYPQASSVGVDISDQKHIVELRRDRKLVISDVFKTYARSKEDIFDSIAIVVPVFKGAEFKGSVEVLVNFASLSKRYLDVIKIGETGYAWVVSRDGTILYTPIPGLTGKSVLETVKDFPSLKVLVNDMLAGQEGVAQYTFERIGDAQVGPTRKYAVCMPVRIGNTFWSIAVASPEQDVLSGLIAFRNKLVLVIGALFICGMVFSTLGAKAWLIIKEEDRRKASETKLRETEQQMLMASEAAKVGHWKRDLARNELWVTDVWRTMFGFNQSEPLNFDKFLQRLHADDRETVRRAVAKAVAGDGSYETEFRVVLPDGRIRWTTSRGRIEYDENHQPVSLRGVTVDITDRKQAESELEQQRQELAHLSRVTTVSELSGSLAHELNQPLGIILSNAQAAQELLLQDPPVVSEVSEILSDIVAADRRAAEVIQRLRALLKRGEVSLQSLPLNDLLEEVLRLVRADLIGRGVIAVCDLAPDLPPITGDRVQLQQLALNLILNAADAMAANAPGRRRLYLTTVRHQHTVRASVRDEGVGLPADVERLFQPFFTTKAQGLGMGLAICRSIIAAHHGRLWAEPHPERGAVFHFELPVAGSQDHP